MAGNEWLNRLTTTDGLELTFDPLLLEGDTEDPPDKADRYKAVHVPIDLKFIFPVVTLLMDTMQRMVLILMMSLAALHPGSSSPETGNGPLIRSMARRWARR